MSPNRGPEDSQLLLSGSLPERRRVERVEADADWDESAKTTVSVCTPISAYVLTPAGLAVEAALPDAGVIGALPSAYSVGTLSGIPPLVCGSLS